MTRLIGSIVESRLQAIFFSTDIFKTAGLSVEGALRATLGLGLVNVLMTLVSMVVVERAGRRTLLLTGLAGMAICTVVLTITLALKDHATWVSYISIAGLAMFVITFAVGPGSIPWFLVTELFGQGARPIATSLAVAVNWAANFIVGLAFLPLMEEIQHYTFLIFTMVLVFFWVFIYKKLPETKNKSIEAITKALLYTTLKGLEQGSTVASASADEDPSATRRRARARSNIVTSRIVPALRSRGGDHGGRGLNQASGLRRSEVACCIHSRPRVSFPTERTVFFSDFHAAPEKQCARRNAQDAYETS
ncbi:hypothetical protein HPB51_009284 [Rhipicephalus microplus]|uniref:Major facilitator superfamily (MFS) profile domain-containing protein n=1 Tax=Rhipicephalus microplus TaxID=6941 RepID=A0A9J6F0Q8_RHIMP|nr:hypothetical protein HPB51_009284 [Rhipicephalus microplus]